MKVLWSEQGAPTQQGLALRKEVFMDEQHFSYDEDELDGISWHLLLQDEDGTAVGAARLYVEDGMTAHLGRIVIKKERRGTGLGLVMLNAMEEKAREMGLRDMKLGGQTRAAGFYEKAGFVRYGEEFYDEYCPHVMLRKEL